MTETSPAPAADADGYAPERWTYGGLYEDGKGKKHAVWYDGGRKRMLYDPKGAGRLLVGGVYEFLVRRDGEQTWRRGDGTWAGKNPDGQWVAELETAAYAADQAIARGQAERRAKRDPGELDKLLGPVERFAAGLNFAQRDALVALVTQKIYRASKDKPAAAPARWAARHMGGG